MKIVTTSLMGHFSTFEALCIPLYDPPPWNVSILEIIIDSLRQDFWGLNEITETFSIKVLQVIELKNMLNITESS